MWGVVVWGQWGVESGEWVMMMGSRLLREGHTLDRVRHHLLPRWGQTCPTHSAPAHPQLPCSGSKCTLKATVENPRGSVEKLSPKESVEGADTVLRG